MSAPPAAAQLCARGVPHRRPRRDGRLVFEGLQRAGAVQQPGARLPHLRRGAPRGVDQPRRREARRHTHRRAHRARRRPRGLRCGPEPVHLPLGARHRVDAGRAPRRHVPRAQGALPQPAHDGDLPQARHCRHGVRTRHTGREHALCGLAHLAGRRRPDRPPDPLSHGRLRRWRQPGHLRGRQPGALGQPAAAAARARAARVRATQPTGPRALQPRTDALHAGRRRRDLRGEEPRERRDLPGALAVPGRRGP